MWCYARSLRNIRLGWQSSKQAVQWQRPQLGGHDAKRSQNGNNVPPCRTGFLAGRIKATLRRLSRGRDVVDLSLLHSARMLVDEGPKGSQTPNSPSD
jgi:hypothetical protein